MNEKQYEEVKNYLEELADSELLDVAFEISSYNGAFEDELWYSMEEFDDYLFGMKPWDIARAVTFGDFNAAHGYFRFDVYGNLESTDYPEIDSNISVDDVMYEIDNIPYNYLPSEITDILDEYEDCEENEENED